MQIHKILAKVLDCKNNISSKKLQLLSIEEKSFIENNTKFLQKNPSLSVRLKCIKFNIQCHQVCDCGELLPYSNNSFEVFRNFCSMSCAKKSPTKETLNKFKESRQKNKVNVEDLNDDILPKEEVISQLKNNIELFKNGGTKSISFLYSNKQLYKSLLFYTNPKNKITQNIFDLLFGKKYCSCGNELMFISLEKGYKNNCNSCGKCISVKIRTTNTTNKAIEYIKKFDDFEIVNYANKLNSPFTLKHKNCGKEFHLWLNNGKLNHLKINCPSCNNKSISSYEIEIKEWLESLNIKVNQQHKFINCNKKFDLELPEHKIIIEFHGLMHHSFGKDSYSMFNNFASEYKNIHKDRTEICEVNGYSLLQIFENEWNTNKHLWKSLIKNKLKLCDVKVFARNCTIKELSQKECDIFLDRNHLQGSINAKYRFGLFYNNELISCMTLSKSRFSKKYNFEILRFASKQNYMVIGGFSKLLSYFRKNNNGTIISYANRRWSTGNVYSKNGFEFFAKTEPNYFYFKAGYNPKLESRTKYQKHKLPNILPKYNNNLTETENMYNNGFRKIYDSGNLIFTLK